MGRLPGDPSRRLPQAATALALLSCLALAACPPARAFAAAAIGFMRAGDVQGLAAYLQAFRGSAWIYTSALMVLQALVAPVPAVAVTLTNAVIYGPWLGALVSWGSALAAAALCMAIGRALGRPFVESVFGPGRVARFDARFGRYGFVSVLAARLVPFVSFDLVSYAAGMTRMRWAPFLVATGIGQLPATLVYSHAGARLLAEPATALLAILAFLGVSVLLLGVAFLHRRERRG